MRPKAPSNWKLLSSDDRQQWLVVHIATDQTNWESSVPKHFDFGSDQLYVYLEKVTFRGRVAIFGGLASSLWITSSIKLGIATIGYIQSGVESPSTNILCSTGTRIYGSYSRSLVAITGRFVGSVIIGFDLNLYTVGSSSDIQLRTLIGGGITTTTPLLHSSIKLVTIMKVDGWLNLPLSNVTGRLSGGISNKGGINLQLSESMALFIGSNTRLYWTAVTPWCTGQFKLRSKIGGEFSGLLGDSLVFTLLGITPIRILGTWSAVFNPITSHVKTLVPNSGSLQAAFDDCISRRTYMLSYSGITSWYTRTCILAVWGKVGPPIIFNVNLTPPELQSAFVGRTVIKAGLALTTTATTGSFFIKVPTSVSGRWLSVVGNDTAAIQIKNWKWFKADAVSCTWMDTVYNSKGIVAIAGKFNPTSVSVSNIEVIGHIKATVPIMVTGNIRLTLASSYSSGIFGYSLLYGKVTLLFNSLQSRFLANVNTGKLDGFFDNLSFKIKLRTIVYITGTFSNTVATTGFSKPPFLVDFSSYGRITTRGVIEAHVSKTDLSGIITAHVPIAPTPIYGGFITSLLNLIPNISAQMRLKYGRLVGTFDTSFSARAYFICTGTWSAELYSVSLTVTWNMHHFAGTLQPVTNSFSTQISGHSRVLVQAHLKLVNLSPTFIFDSHPGYRGVIDLIIDAYQDSYIPAYNGGVFANIGAVYKSLVYGKIETTTKSIQFIEMSGITPRKIMGLWLGKLGWDYSVTFVRVACGGVVELSTTPSAFKNVLFFGQSNTGILDIRTVGLDIYKNEIKGIAAHAIFGVFYVKMYDEPINSPNGFILPLQVAFKGRSKIYGNILILTQNLKNTYFRGGNEITGRLLGGDTAPNDQCYPHPWPCLPELEERIGHPIDKFNKVYWTLGYATGDIWLHVKIQPNGFLKATFEPVDITIQAHMEIYAVLDVKVHSYVEWLTGFIAFGIFKGFLVSGEMDSTLSDFKAKITLNSSILKMATLSADLKHCVGQFGGYSTVKGHFSATLVGTSLVIWTKVPMPYTVDISATLDSLTPHWQLYTPLQNYGVLINHLLNELTTFGSFNGYMTCYCKGVWSVDGIDHTDIWIKLFNILGVLSPVGKLDRVFVQILGTVPESGEGLTLKKGWFLAQIPNTLTSQIRLAHAIYQRFTIATEDTYSSIQAITPIRIYVDTHVQLKDVSSSISLMAWTVGRFIPTLLDISTFLTSIYIPRVTVNFDILSQDSNTTILGVALIAGTLPQELQTISSLIPTYHCTYGYGVIQSDWMTANYFGVSYMPCVDLPKEPMYTVGGKVENTLSVGRTYTVTLYDQSTMERVQKHATPVQAPFDYVFNQVVYGPHFVLCVPARTLVGSKVRTFLVDDEKVDRLT